MSWFKRDNKESVPEKSAYEKLTEALDAAGLGLTPEEKAYVNDPKEHQEYLERKAHSDNQWQRIECYGYKKDK